MAKLARAPHLSSIALALALAGCGSTDDPAASTAATTTSVTATGAGGAGGATTTATGSGGAGGATTTTTTASGGAGGAGAAGADTTVTPFDQAHVYFTGDDNKRQLDVPASFPATGDYEKISLHLALDCPKAGGCDAWDRFGTLGVVTAKGADGAPDTVVEVARFITPYKVKAGWDLDVTDLRPLLTGDVTLRVFIDTWVGPGSPYGAGWLVTASFDLKGGTPAKKPLAVVPVISPRAVTYGDPAKPVADSAPPATLALPKASSYAVRAFITGHGQGNKDNCAEFCPREHTVRVEGAEHSKLVWRTDCAKTAAPNQQGTWKLSRAGWCPGALVAPWSFDVTADVAGKADATFAYDVQIYENTCRPDAEPCAGCSLGTGCAYDGGAHTEPSYQLSAVLVAYE
jgi:hypothetical protein